MAIVSHLANGSKGRVHRADRYITITLPTIFVVVRVRVAERLTHLALCARRICVVDW